MAPKLISFSVIAIFLLACLSLLACASPIPIILPPSEGITLFKDVVAREALPEVGILKRVAAPALDLHVLSRDEDTGHTTEPSILVDDPDNGLEARICRYGCL
ncbi:uncharacterized protein EDB91DRAFT_1248240 [Suillus paluster]|uniref:uncharacterized protein n=1 Tax=Suillus paluster TaxID=48578 RepID=UPI001B86B960|nr:uncharacterized protein EDB91DRAFT_1248240 [Suillus paluster]KAG1740857.1 hypothetical protein EDB91DRAFT_1248240 [Suillus paluster]